MASHIDKQIIATATAEFSRVGYSGIAMSELAKKAEVTEGSIFRIFGTKDKLFELAVKQAIVQVENEVSSVGFALAREQGFEAAIRNAVRRTYAIISVEFARLRAFAVLERPELSGLFDQCVGAFEKSFSHALDIAIVDGKLRDDLDPHVAAHHLVAVVLDCKLFGPVSTSRSRNVQNVHSGKPSPVEKRRRASVDAFVEILLRGIGKPERRPRRTRS